MKLIPLTATYKKLGVWIMGLTLQLIMFIDDKIITFLKFSIAQDEHALSILP